MACVLHTADNGKINKVTDGSNEPSKLFQQIYNIPILSLEDSIKIYQNTFSDKVQKNKKELNLNGNIYTSNTGESYIIKIYDGINGEVIDLESRKNKDKIGLSVVDSAGNKVASMGLFKDLNDNMFYANIVNVKEEYQRQGIASSLYQFLKNENIAVKDSEIQTEAGKALKSSMREPALVFETPSGQNYLTYLEALQNTDQGEISLKVNDVVIGKVNSDTNIDTFEGALNYFVKQGVLTGERILDVDGSEITVTAGDTITAKQLTADSVENIATKLLGESGVQRMNDGNFIFTKNLNTRIINGEKVKESDVDKMTYDELKTNYGEETAIQIETERETEKQLLPTTLKRRIDEDTDIKTEDELVRSAKNLLNSLGVKITSIEDYEKNTALKNDGVHPDSTALADIVNKVIAFRNGEVTRNDLIEETMHFIEASLDPAVTEPVRRMIHTTPEWQEHSQLYYDIYSKEYSGEKLEEVVRREILGKVMANAVSTNFELSQNATITQQSIFDQIRNFLQQFFDKVNAYFSPNTQSQIDQLNNDIFVKLMAGELADDLNINQNYGTKLRLYSASRNISDDLVQIQRQAENALTVLESQSFQIAKNDATQRQLLKQARESLGKATERFDVIKDISDIIHKSQEEKLARAELAASFSYLTNVAKKQLTYLQRAVKRNAQNNFHFSSEEQAVYSTMLSQFDRYILPAAKKTLEDKKDRTKAEDKILEEIDKTISEVQKLKGQVATLDRKSKDVVVDLLAKRLDLSDEQRQFVQNQVDAQQSEVSWFFNQFGTLAHSSNILLNAAGHVISKTVQESREGFLTDLQPFIKRLKDSGYLSGAKTKEFAKDGYIENRFNDKAREEAISQMRYEIYKDISGDNISKEEYDKMTTFPKLTVEQQAESERRFEDWYLDNIALSATSAEQVKLRKQELAQYSVDTQRYERNSRLAFFNIVQNAEIQDGIPVYTEDMKYDFEQLKKQRTYDKSIFTVDGELKDGIEYRSEEEYESTLVEKDGAQQETDIVKISNNLYASLVPGTADSASILAFELSKIDNNRLAVNKVKNRENQGFPTEFTRRLSELDSKQAYDFLTLNSYIGYTNEYYESFNNQSLIDRLKEELGGDNDYQIRNLIENIAVTTKKKNTILQSNREMNNPSETNYDNMEKNSEVSAIKEYEEDLERYYREASAIIGKRGEIIDEDNISETIPNRAFRSYMNDTARVSQLVYDKDVLDEIDLENIDKIFNAITEHTTLNKKTEVLDLRKFVQAFASGRENKIDKRYSRVFSLTADEYREMSEQEIFAYMTNEALQYSYTRLLPYFRKSQPTGVDRALFELEAGVLKPSDFMNNYFKGEYPYLQITPNYNFQEANETNHKNPHFQQAKLNGTPMFRTFEVETTEADVKNKSVDQLYNEGKLNKYVSKDFLKEYDIDLVHLFNTGEERARKNEKKFEARQAFLDLQKQSLTKLGEFGRHNLYQLPQKEKGKFRKIEDLLKREGGVKAIAEEFFTFREDDADLGQDTTGKANVSLGVRSIPKKGIRKLSNEQLTDELLESFSWFSKEANLFEARQRNISDMLAIKESLLGSEFENNLSVEATRTYKMFDDFMKYNFFDVKETFSKQFKIFGIQGDYAKVLKSFGDLIRLRNLGFTVISPITSLLTARTQITIERLVGEAIDTDAVKKAKKLMNKYSGDSLREVMNFESKSWINAVGQKYGFFDTEERFNNSNYGKSVRFLGRSPYIMHTVFNFPSNPLGAISVLADHKFVNGRVLQYREFRQQNKHKTDRELRNVWKDYVDLTDVIVVDETGVVVFDYKKIADAMNTDMTPEQAKTYMDNINSLIYTRVKQAIERIDGQITNEDRIFASRNAYTSFLTLHRNWMFIAAANRFKGKHFSLATREFQEGSYLTAFRGVKDLLQDVVSGKAYRDLNYFKNKWQNASDTTKKNLKRVGVDLAVLNALVALTLYGFKELDDEDPDSALFKFATYMTLRTANEVASASTALPQNMYDVLGSMTVGLNALDIIYDAPDLFSGEEVTRGKYQGLSKRQRYLFRNIPLLKDYSTLSDLDGAINSYKYFNIDQGNAFDYGSIYPFLIQDIEDKN